MATTKQRQRVGAGPSQSRLLQLLRKHGYTEDLPPSTVSWLDSRPAFRWLADNLSDDNFVSPEMQALYDTIQLQSGGDGAGPGHARAQLMSAMGIASDSGSDDDDGEGGAAGHGGPAAAEARRDRAIEDGGWGEPQSVEDLQRAIEAQQAHRELLQRQLSSVGAVSRRIAAATASGPCGASQQQRSLLGSVRASQLRAAQTAAAEAGRELDVELQQLVEEMAGWSALAEGGPGTEDWLLCTIDASEYAARNADMQELINRGMSLVSAAAGVAPPLGVADRGDDTAAAAADSSDDTGSPDAAAKAAASLWGRGADAQRWRDQERRNEGLKEELTRQRLAFKVAYDQHMAAVVRRAGAEGALAAVEGLVEAERQRRHVGARLGAGAAGGVTEGPEAILKQVGVACACVGWVGGWVQEGIWRWCVGAEPLDYPSQAHHAAPPQRIHGSTGAPAAARGRGAGA